MTDYRNRIFNEDCMVGLDRIPDKSIDLVLMDPPYEQHVTGGGCFGPDNRDYFGSLEDISDGISEELLDKIVSKMVRINLYVWCNKSQIHQYLNYFAKREGVSMDLLTWHKTNPVPTCSNKYLSDTEYCLFFREKGVKLYGNYDTKRKWYVSPLNVSDKALYHHPTIKPLEITKNLITNSVSSEGGTVPIVLDPFMGSGTTAVAAKQLGFDYVGFEIDPEYYGTAVKRVSGTSVTNLDCWGMT